MVIWLIYVTFDRLSYAALFVEIHTSKMEFVIEIIKLAALEMYNTFQMCK